LVARLASFAMLVPQFISIAVISSCPKPTHDFHTTHTTFAVRR
jgi:hypothetical protein